MLNSFSIAPGTNPDQEISVTISDTDATMLFVLLSKTQTTPPTASLLRASGVALAGTTTNYTFSGLDRGATYYGWAVATRQSNESDVMPSAPAFLRTDPYTFINSGLLTFTRASVATRVNAVGLIETVPMDTARLDHDPVTLVQKGLLIEESRANLLIRSNELTNDTTWFTTNTTIITSTDFPIFASGGVFLLSGNNLCGFKAFYTIITTLQTTYTISINLRRNTNNFARILTGGPDVLVYAN